MAFSVTTITNDPSFKVWEVSALDGDSGQHTFAHGFVDPSGNPIAPLAVWVVPIQTEAAYVGQWVDDGSTATLMRIRKQAAGVNSGGVVRVIAMRPHSLIRS